MGHPLEQLYDARVSSEAFPLVERWNAAKGYPEWVETEPGACPNGHPWGRPYSMRRGHVACLKHDGHRTWTCGTCEVTVLNPPHEGTLPAEKMPRL